MNIITRKKAPSGAHRLRFPAFPVAGLAGTSFKHEHLGAILAGGSQEGFFEVHAENYMGAGGPPHRALGGVDSKDSLLRANQIQSCFLGGSLGCDGAVGFERRGVGSDGAADHRSA